jgi:hypothetical protein
MGPTAFRPRTTLARATVLLCLLVAPGCDGSPAAPGDDPEAPLTRDAAALFQTDSLAYGLRTTDWIAGEIDVTLTNRTTQPIHLSNCNGASSLQLERRAGDRWQAVWSPLLPLCASAPIIVSAGGTYRTRITIPAAPPATVGLRVDDPRAVAGEYRLVWTSALGPPFTDLLPLASRVSNRFRLRVEQP